MKILLTIVAILFLSGCTTYSIEKSMPDGSSTVVHIKSTRSFEQPDLSYAREGSNATFDFKAANADNNTDAFMGAISPMLSGMMDMMNTMMMKITAPVP